MGSLKKCTPKSETPSQKSLIPDSVVKALNFAREEDAKRAADPIAYHLGLIYQREKLGR